jgi:hypothetical protein
MSNLKEDSLSNAVEDVSQKVAKLNNIPSTRSLNLPRGNYGPFCLKIIQEFVAHHKLPANLPVPVAGLSTHVALSRIFDIMLHSMGEEKREEILKNLDEYNMSVPACFRQ